MPFWQKKRAFFFFFFYLFLFCRLTLAKKIFKMTLIQLDVFQISFQTHQTEFRRTGSEIMILKDGDLWFLFSFFLQFPCVRGSIKFQFSRCVLADYSVKLLTGSLLMMGVTTAIDVGKNAINARVFIILFLDWIL
jgi:hypothetical protein